MCFSQVKSPIPVTQLGQPDFHLELYIVIPAPDQQGEATFSTESTLDRWGPGSRPIPQITHLLWSCAACTITSDVSLLMRLANACERWRRVAVTDFQICFDSPRFHLPVISYYRFVFRALAVHLSVEAGQKPGNKGGISRLISLQTCFGRTNHFITTFTIGHPPEQQYFMANFQHLGFIQQLLSINLLSYPYLLSCESDGQECWAQIMKTMFQPGFKSLCEV